MALSIPQIVRQFKADVAQALSTELIVRLCQALGHTWRERVLDPTTTVQVFLLQILHGNTACTALARLAGLSFASSAYCAARSRLPLALFAELLQRVCDGLWPEVHRTSRWRGHRTWLLDGSSFSMPDTPELQAHFGQPSGQAKGCGFPVAHLLALFHAGTGVVLKVVTAPLRTHDMRQAVLMHPELDPGDLLIADRGFASYAHLALLLQRKLHGVFRGHQKQIVSFRKGRRHTGHKSPLKGLPRSRYVKRLGYEDQIVEYVKPLDKSDWMDEQAWAAVPQTLLVRELRYRTPQKGHRTKVITLVTTLLDADLYPKAELARLYLQRWDIEVNFRHLKTTMGMAVLHCQTVEGVLKELYMFAIAYNLVRLVMLEAARRQRVPLDRISFIDALRWLRDADADSPLTVLHVNPPRPNRLEPRVVKRRPKPYPLMRKPRAVLRKALPRKKGVA